MPIEIVGDTDANQLDIDEQFARETEGGIVIFNGSGSRVSVRTNQAGRHFRVDVDDNSSFEMGEGAFVDDLHVHLRGGAQARYGADSFAIGSLRLYCHEHSRLEVGDGCLIGDDVLCMTSDMHSVIDTTTQERINPPGDIKIGNRVWIGAGVTVLKGTLVGEGAIIGIKSVVMGEFPKRCLLLGYPARLVRSNVSWANELLPLRQGGAGAP